MSRTVEPEHAVAPLHGSAPPPPAEQVHEVTVEVTTIEHGSGLGDLVSRTPLLRRLAPLPIWIATAWHYLIGVVTLILGLAVLVAIPIFQFLTLGYFLEAAGRTARSGKLRRCAVGVDEAARVGSVFAGFFVFWLPLQFLVSLRDDARLIDSTSPMARSLSAWTFIAFVVVLLHTFFAAARGGRLRYFAQPIRNGRWFVQAIRERRFLRDSVGRLIRFVGSLRLGHYFWLGVRGFAGTGIWLLVPSVLLAVGRETPPLAFLGGFTLSVVLLYLPFLQIRFAAENRMSAIFEVRAVRRRYARAPIAFLISFVFCLLASIPLYLLKIEVVPGDAVWMLALLFIVTIFPLKILIAWSYARAGRRYQPRFFLPRWSCKVVMFLVAVIYSYIVFLTQYTSWHGASALFENHAFLLPAPF